MSSPLVLLVDDDDDSRMSIREALEAEGYAVDIAADGERALERLRNYPPPDLVLLDVLMPKMDGLTVVKTLEDDSGHLPIDIVLLTALTDAECSVECAVLRKPIDLDTLLQVVAEHTGGAHPAALLG